MADPRPHLGEPLALDLLDTRWNDGGVQDLLDDTDGLRIWLHSTGLAQRADADEPTLAALRAAREAVYDVVTRLDGTGRIDPAAAAALDAVLEHGRIRPTMTAGGPLDVVIADRTHLPAWLAAADLLDLLRRAPDRIRRCAHPDCILFFYDTSKNGTRRWHSMATCGNRAKAARHHAKHS